MPLSASGSRTRSGSATPTNINSPATSPPGPQTVARGARWTFWDSTTNTTGTFVFNPQAGGEVPYDTQLASGGSAGSWAEFLDSGASITYGPDRVSEVTFNGFILTEADWNFFNVWFNNDNLLLLTDDLGRKSWILMQSFVPARVRKATSPWFHTYVAKALRLGGNDI